MKTLYQLDRAMFLKNSYSFLSELRNYQCSKDVLLANIQNCCLGNPREKFQSI